MRQSGTKSEADSPESAWCRDASDHSWWLRMKQARYQWYQPHTAFEHFSQGIFWFLTFFSMQWVTCFYYGTDLFSLSKKHQISHVSQTELFVNKTGRLRLFYLPFQGPDIRVFTQDGVAHAISAWKTSHNLPPKPTVSLPCHSVKTLCDAEDFVRRSESKAEKSTLRAPLSCTQTQPRKLLKPPQSKLSWQRSSSTVFLRYKF